MGVAVVVGIGKGLCLRLDKLASEGLQSINIDTHYACNVFEILIKHRRRLLKFIRARKCAVSGVRVADIGYIKGRYVHRALTYAMA